MVILYYCVDCGSINVLEGLDKIEIKGMSAKQSFICPECSEDKFEIVERS